MMYVVCVKVCSMKWSIIKNRKKIVVHPLKRLHLDELSNLSKTKNAQRSFLSEFRFISATKLLIGKCVPTRKLPMNHR